MCIRDRDRSIHTFKLGTKYVTGGTRVAKKLAWAKIDPWYLAGSRPKYHGQTRLRHQKRAKSLKEGQKNYLGSKLTQGIWQGQGRNIMVKQGKKKKKGL